MGLLDDLKQSGPNADDRPPKEWAPRSDIDSVSGGYIITTPSESGDVTDHAAQLELHDLDPDAWTVVSVRKGKWQTYDERWLHTYRINVIPKAMSKAARVDAEQVVAQISKWRPRTPSKVVDDLTFHAPVGDTQIGKIDGGGSTATVTRFLSELDRTVARQRKFKAAKVHLPWLGDCIEGIVSQGGKVAGRLDLTLTEQVRIVRRLVMAQIKAFAPLTEVVEVAAIPGNHDEATRSLLTTGDDSWAVDAISAVMDGVMENPELRDRVKFLFPRRDELTLVSEHSGVVTALAHGHQFGRGADYALKWWDGQASGRTPVGDATLLLSAHRHHLRVQDHGGGRMWIQIPALDGGSQWFKERHGDHSTSRMVSFITVDGRVRELDPVL